MNNKDLRKERKSDINFSFLIQALYGLNDYRRVKNNQTIVSAKRYYKKIIDTFAIAIEETITVSDKVQMELLKSILSEGKESLSRSKTFDSLDNTFICTQTQLILQLIGNNPNRFIQKNVPNRKDKWTLNSHRQIQYTQTNEQKLNQIYNIIQEKYRNKFPDFMNDFFYTVYVDECESDFEKLMIWMKINHTDIYLDMI